MMNAEISTLGVIASEAKPIPGKLRLPEQATLALRSLRELPFCLCIVSATKQSPTGWGILPSFGFTVENLDIDQAIT
jgi:hypothetical protein